MVAGSLTDRVRAIVLKYLPIDPEQLTDEAEFIADLGADQLDQLSIIMWAEDEFHVTISDVDAEKVVTFGDLVRLIERLPRHARKAA